MMCHWRKLYHFWRIIFGYHFLLTASVAVVKSRDLHWGLLATKDHKEVSLSSLRLLLVADGANPWSLSSCDQFLSVFQAKGLRPDAICPCASSSECLTVSVRRWVQPHYTEHRRHVTSKHRAQPEIYYQYNKELCVMQKYNINKVPWEIGVKYLNHVFHFINVLI
jgi:hypothetical protein